MGMPISNYDFFRALALGAPDYQVSSVNESLKSFSLFAFILHDPELHSDFHLKLIELFERLDYITGDKLLFFAPVDPPSAWKNKAGAREYYSKVKGWEAKQVFDPAKVPTSNDPSLTVFAMAKSLGLSMEDLPCVIVTSNLGSKDFNHFPVSKDTLEKQMTELGYFAEQIDPVHSRHMKLAETSLSYAITNPRTNSHRVEVNLAQALSDALSLIYVAIPLGFSHGNAVDQARTLITDLYNRLDEAKSDQPGEINAQVDDLSVKIMAFLALLNQKANSQEQNIVPINNELLEYESRQILRTASKVYELLATNQGKSIDSVLETTDDFSPGVIALCKVFELESNLSVVHWVRKKLGIALPAYFDKVEPGKSAVHKNGDFNKSNRKGDWMPPGIGQSEIAFRDLAIVTPPENWDTRSIRYLVDRWGIIRENRNAAAHDRIVQMGALEDVRKALTELAQSDYFQKFYEMKLAYSGRTHAS